MSASDTGTDVEEAPATDRDAAPKALLAELSEVLGAAAVLGSEVRNGDLWMRVAAADWKRTTQACRDVGFDYFCFLSGIDWMQSTSPNPRASVSDTVEGLEEEGGSDEPEPEPDEPTQEPEAGTDGMQTGFAGGDSRFQVFARLYSTHRHQGVTLKADLVDTAPFVDSIIDVYAGADWNERETWEMYGFHFVGHPNLIHLYLPGEFEGFPLRKDFPLLSREVKPWPGLVDVEPMPEVPEALEPEAPAPEAVTAAAGGTTVTETAADAPASDLPEGTVAVGDSAVAEEPAVRERQDPEPPADLPTITPDAEAAADADAAEATASDATTEDVEASDEEPGA